MDTGINQVVKDGNGNAILFTALMAAIVANVLPTPADALYFSAQQKDKERLENGLITPSQYWRRDMIGYYAYTGGYYLIIFLALQALGGTYKNNARVLLAVLSGGLVLGVYGKNVSRDEEIPALHEQQSKALGKGAPACAPPPAVCTKF